MRLTPRSVTTTLAVATLPAALLAVPTLGADPAPKVPYPEGFRTWTHVKSMVIEPGHGLEKPFGGMHHVYADAAALEGLRSGAYRDGATLVFDLLEAKAADKAVTEGARKLSGVMRRDAKAYAATGGWGFEGFAGDSKTERLVTDGGASCFECHKAGAAGSAFVFSRWRP